MYSKRLTDAILEWPVPKSITEFQIFMGFANYYRLFIKYFLSTAKTISDLVRFKIYDWVREKSEAFQKLKEVLRTALVLAQFSSSKEFLVGTDAFKYALGALFEQKMSSNGIFPHRLSNQ